MGEPLSGTPDPERRPDSLVSWGSDWGGLRVVVLGLDAEGFAAADTLVELGAEVVVLGGEESPELVEILHVLGVRTEQLESAPPAERLADLQPELVIVSAKLARDSPAVSTAELIGIPVWSDVELAWRLRDKHGVPSAWIAITGDGDVTATAELTAAMLLAQGVRAAPAGGARIPVLDAVRDPAGFAVLVVELSGSQLHWLARSSAPLEPLASACLAAEGQDGGWHRDEQERRTAFGAVYSGTRIACVYRSGDPVTRHMVEEAEVQEGARAIGVGLGIPGLSELGVVDGILVDRAFLEERRSHALELGTTDDLAHAGRGDARRGYEALVAAALARAAGAEPSAVLAGLRSGL